MRLLVLGGAGVLGGRGVGQARAAGHEVSAMSATMRGQWVGVFNDAHARCLKGQLKLPPGETKAEQPSCEGRAMRMANGVVKEGKKEVDEELPANALDGEAEAGRRGPEGGGGIGVDTSGPAHVEVQEKPPDPFAGVRSFSELDELRDLQHRQYAREDTI